jgi:hypothetical protein
MSLRKVLLATLPFFAVAVLAQQGPDLTTTNLALIDTSKNYSLGPTGLRGWIYVPYPGGAKQNYISVQGQQTGFAPYQVLVVNVGSNTPASGVIQSNDVLLGVSIGLGNLPVPLFTNDTRKAIGAAIGEAEAGDGWMNFKVWRAGVTNDVSIQLPLSGLAYSTTAPYDCPKSAVILSNAINIISNRSFNLGSPGNQVLGLALLATGDTNLWPKVQTYARSITDAGSSQWSRSYVCIFLAEYYLKTGDTNVLPVLKSTMLNMARGMDRYGSSGHNPSRLNDNGSYNGTAPGYGPVNCVGLSCALGMVLGQKSLVAAGIPVDAEVSAALTRSANFFRWYVQKGTIPYGEHNPWGGGYYHYSNGKLGLASLLFSVLGDQPVETEYWIRMTMAGYLAREYGHTGQAFNYIWDALGVNLGGTNALASYVSSIRWHLDLERRSDGSFVYDGKEQYGPSTVSDYWMVGGNNDYYGVDPTSMYVLTYAAPRQQIYITGRDANPTNVLSNDKVTNAIWVAAMPTISTNLTTNELMAALGEYDPEARYWAAQELGARTNVSLASITNLISSTNAWLRASACTVLGAMKNTNGLALVAQSLSDPDISVRALAGIALKKFGAAGSPVIPAMLTAFTNNALDPNSIDWDDPVHSERGSFWRLDYDRPAEQRWLGCLHRRCRPEPAPSCNADWFETTELSVSGRGGQFYQG